ncbi:uncharacterized protein LOC26534534 [Drosophila yakuba]|uniref:BPTI/Kunitz inhibitor domain-containing protein n=1 Tax=Drosophila yakuba TaxID=7245 RepID=A0A0R1DQI1_DROYA|nr:uncharacterized protein LOC26534534 [Drosophila yakuba]KRJ97217.1 uncharacterized protein Dyak_GE27353 [Drosophila yakuba]
MKFVALISLMFIASCVAQQKTDLQCYMDPLPEGFCGEPFIGYTYSSARTRCVIHETQGCTISGNFFTDKAACEAKCKPPLTFSASPFSYFHETVFEQANKLIKQLISQIL